MAILDKDTQEPDTPVLAEITANYASQKHFARLHKLWTVPLMLVALLLILITPQSPYDHAFVATKLSDLNVVLHTGPFVRHSLSAVQVNEMMHLITHMAYKQLAHTYVADMTLDEELGQ